MTDCYERQQIRRWHLVDLLDSCIITTLFVRTALASGLKQFYWNHNKQVGLKSSQANLQHQAVRERGPWLCVWKQWPQGREPHVIGRGSKIRKPPVEPPPWKIRRTSSANEQALPQTSQPTPSPSCFCIGKLSLLSESRAIYHTPSTCQVFHINHPIEPPIVWKVVRPCLLYRWRNRDL